MTERNKQTSAGPPDVSGNSKECMHCISTLSQVVNIMSMEALSATKCWGLGTHSPYTRLICTKGPREITFSIYIPCRPSIHIRMTRTTWGNPRTSERLLTWFPFSYAISLLFISLSSREILMASSLLHAAVLSIYTWQMLTKCRT